MEPKYHYQTDSDGIYVAPILCRVDPQNDARWLVPYGAYPEEPPPLAERQCARRVGDDWVILPDWRGFTYWTADRVAHVINEWGVEPPEGHLLVCPPKPLAEVKVELNAAIQAAIGLLEAGQARPAREVALAMASGQPVPQFALDRLTEIESAIADCRQALADVQAAENVAAAQEAAQGVLAPE